MGSVTDATPPATTGVTGSGRYGPVTESATSNTGTGWVAGQHKFNPPGAGVVDIVGAGVGAKLTPSIQSVKPVPHVSA